MEPSPGLVAAHLERHRARDVLGAVGAAPIVVPDDAPPVVRYRAAGFARKLERLAGHAPAPIDTERHRERKLTKRELLHVLKLIVFGHLEVISTQSCDELTFVIGHGRVDLDELRLRRKRRERAFLPLIRLLPLFLLLRSGRRRHAAAQGQRHRTDEPPHF